MDRKTRLLIIGLFLISPLIGFGQDRYAISYHYKPQTSFDLENPREFLLERSLQRRIREGIGVDSTDMPVSQKYTREVSALVEDVYFHSKWLNSSIVQATEEQIDRISDLPFIRSTELVGRGYYDQSLDGKKEAFRIPISFKVKTKKLNTYDFQNDILGIPAMHEAGFTGAGVMIAVFDAGFINTDKITGLKHLFEEKQIVATRDFVMHGSSDVFKTDAHGTASLSVMAAYEPGKLIAGAYEASYILCITEDVQSEFRIEEYNWVRAAEFSDSLGVDIINSSLGYNFFDDPAMNYEIEDLDGNTAIISRGASLAAQKGILVVSSAGNEGNGSWGTITVPADADGILAIGSVNNNLERSNFSSTGPTADGRIKPDLMAYGSGVTVWKQEDAPGASSGTSFTSPQVAALAAGLRQAKPNWTTGHLIDRLKASGSLAEDPTVELGYGIPNFIDAYYGEILDMESEEMKRAYIYPNPLDQKQLFIHYGSETKCDFKMINALGMLVTDQVLSRTVPRHPYEIRLDDNPPGLYFIECRENGERKVFRLIVK